MADKTLLEQVHDTYRTITQQLVARGKTITTMESCTSGLVASLITDTEGSSAALRGAFVTYANEAKVAVGVPAQVIETYGVYSEQTARAMALVARERYEADFGIGITGTMGNVDPANDDSVPGEVYVAIAVKREGAEGPEVHETHLSLPPEPSRFDYKLVVANKVANVLLPLIMK